MPAPHRGRALPQGASRPACPPHVVCSRACVLAPCQVHHFLDSFYVSRIGIRILIGQYLELHHPQEVRQRCTGPLRAQGWWL